MTEPGPLLIIGGHEDKTGERTILRALARELDGRKLVIATIASHKPEGYFESYRQALQGLHLGELVELYVEDSTESDDDATLGILDGAAGVFFSGGDQDRIRTRLSGTPLERAVRSIWKEGGIIAGTSAGASALGETMIVRGPGDESYRPGELHIEDGLGFVEGVIIDQHFAERGRIGRLLGAAARRPHALGIGIDEDTAIMVSGDRFEVLGAGAVYVLDGTGITQPEVERGEAASLFDVKLHLLSAGDGFGIAQRRPHG
jgi:cyanophycinase